MVTEKQRFTSNDIIRICLKSLVPWSVSVFSESEGKGWFCLVDNGITGKDKIPVSLERWRQSVLYFITSSKLHAQQ